MYGEPNKALCSGLWCSVMRSCDVRVLTICCDEVFSRLDLQKAENSKLLRKTEDLKGSNVRISH